jgi:oxygen-independent coproporphyrinogen-3 oxidase
MGNDARDRLQQAIAASELPCYVYSYPSKRAYRPFDPPVTIAEAWGGAAGPLNLYIHIPFCAYRCSFCTLFLTTSHGPDLVQAYVDALCRQMEMYGPVAGHMEVISLYIGGGTPTTLSLAQFSQLFDALRRQFPRWSAGAEISVEGSPDSMTVERLACLKREGVTRVSMGLQTLDPDEQRRVGRPYAPGAVHAAVEAINAAGFDNVNYDLIYGLEGQQRESWFASLGATVAFAPKTITLYPVVFRPLTAIQKRAERDTSGFLPDESKYALYDESVVRFTTLPRGGLRQEAADFAGVPLLGLGAGARSYSDRVHYSTDYAVRRTATLDIIGGFITHAHTRDHPADRGFLLDDDERRRRFCVLNLSLGRLDPSEYSRRFGGGGLADVASELEALVAEGCVDVLADGAFQLTPRGFKYSNVMGELFKSRRVDALERSYVPE